MELSIMETVRPATGQEPADWRNQQVAHLAQELSRIQRTLGRARRQYLDTARHDVERAAQALISSLAAGGPMRLGSLAVAVQSDPSTVSRQVSGLVRDGYVERRADPDDGRAVVLAVTEAGELVYREFVRNRETHYAAMLSGWSSEDIVTFASLLSRFDNEFERHQANWSQRADASGAPPTRSGR
ncbi:MarR family winged helix-turn-helix transcriptional regulator [Frankia sp. AgB32]|uniref:MarR family winged helix-turn-helix transcriptional regulator n=1 Tax=Frankia sp. AgB32 TaxID=631119 RepID=UPI00200E6E9A|nr:MarR family transcriptional regulator [Frankia sp. AgB32]MCK9894802.1 MarR family transcriptional regulator [Frankia sp. AgB32]